MLTCKEVADNASDYLDMPTGLRRRLELRLHLLMCKHCRRFLAQFRTASRAASELAEVPPPTDREIDDLVAKLSAGARD